MFGFGRFVKKRVSTYLENLLSRSARQLLAQQAEVLERMESRLTERMESRLQEYHQANFFNQLTLANRKEGPILLSIPWNHNQRKTINLERLADGALGFNPPVTSSRKPVFIVTLPKSGTNILARTLHNLGYNNSLITFESGIIRDGRTVKRLGISNADVSDRIVLSNAQVNTSFTWPLVTQLSQNGFFFLAHISDAESLRQVHRDGAKILLCVRDLRYLSVSYLRWAIRTNQITLPDMNIRKFPDSSELRSEYLLNFFTTGMMFFLLACARAYAKVLEEPFVRLVRFEDLTSPDRETVLKPAQAIAELTECSVETALKALKEADGVQTLTYSGRHSKLGAFWTQEVEDKFCELGADVLNEQLGYSRSYTPQS